MKIKAAEGSVVLFAVCKDDANKYNAIEHIRAELDNTPHHHISLRDDRINPIDVLENLPIHPQQIVHFCFADRWERDIPDEPSRLEKLARNINMRRDSYQTQPHVVVFWIQELNLAPFAKYAPELWAWHSGCFFSFKQPVPKPWVPYDQQAREKRAELAYILQEYGQDSAAYAMARSSLAVVLVAMGHYEKAQHVYNELIAIDGQIYNDDLAYATYLCNLAGVLESTKQYEKAENLYRQVLHIRETLLVDDKTDYAITLTHVARLMCITGHYEEAEKLSNQALDLWEKTIREIHLGYAESLHTLAKVQETRGIDDTTEHFYRKALNVDAQIIPRQHPTYAQHLADLANVLSSMRRFEEAKTLYHQAVDIFAQTVGKRHPKYIATMDCSLRIIEAVKPLAKGAR